MNLCYSFMNASCTSYQHLITQTLLLGSTQIKENITKTFPHRIDSYPIKSITYLNRYVYFKKGKRVVRGKAVSARAIINTGLFQLTVYKLKSETGLRYRPGLYPVFTFGLVKGVVLIAQAETALSLVLLKAHLFFLQSIITTYVCFF